MEGDTLQQFIKSDTTQSVKLSEQTSGIAVEHWDNRQKTIMGYMIASLCFLSEAVHLWLLPEQYEVFSVYGIIFLLIAMAQGSIGVIFLFEPRRRIMTFGLWINILVVFLYTFTHTIGVLVGKAFLPLPIDVLGVVATTIEVLIIVLLFMIRSDFPRQKKQKQRTQRRKKQTR